MRCSFVVEVELPDDADEIFMIEENGCPGTGVVGNAVEKLSIKHDESEFCEYCNCEGKNEIVSVNGLEVDRRPKAHSFRPFTTRDGSMACAECHAPPDHPVHRRQLPE